MRPGASINAMPDNILFDLDQARAAHIAVSPQYEHDKICVILQLNYAEHANFSMLRVHALFGRMLGQPPPEHFGIIITALPVDLPTVLNNQEGGRSNDWRLQGHTLRHRAPHINPGKRK